MKIPVCIFAKPPAPLEAKTRLIPALGAEGAAQLASAMLRDVWRAVQSHPGVHPILATTRPGAFPMSLPDADMWLQGEGDLGERMERIITRGAPVHAPAVMAIGADSPAFSACAHLGQGCNRLPPKPATRCWVPLCGRESFYHLLALRRYPRGLFASLPWSAGETHHHSTRDCRNTRSP